MTRTTCRRSTGSAAALGASSSSSAASASYWRFSRTSAATMTGTRTMITHAPWVNFVTAMMTSTRNESDRAGQR